MDKKNDVKTELAFIWLDNHVLFKNIGFNFSHRYKIEYNENKLIIEEKKDIISQLYLDNVQSIHAIVGENGAGKTQLLEAIEHSLNIITERLGNKTLDVPLNVNCECKFDFITVFIHNFDIYVVTTLDKFEFNNDNRYTISLINIKDDELSKKEKFVYDNFIPIYYSTVFDEKSIYKRKSYGYNVSTVMDLKDTFDQLKATIKDSFVNAGNRYKHLLSSYEKNHDYNIKSSFDSMYMNMFEDAAGKIISPIDLFRNVSMYKDIQWIYNMYKHKESEIKLYKIPSKVLLQLRIESDIRNTLRENYPEHWKQINTIIQLVEEKVQDPNFQEFFYLLIKEIIEVIPKSNIFDKIFMDSEEYDINENLTRNDFFILMIEYLRDINIEENSDGYCNIIQINDVINGMINVIDNSIESPSKNMILIKNLIKLFEIFTIPKDGQRFITDSFDFHKTVCDVSVNYDKLEYIILATKAQKNINFIDIKIEFDNFSSGEIMRYKIFSRLFSGIINALNRYIIEEDFAHHTKKQKKDNKKKVKESLYLLLLDEPELCMHPKWQKDFVSSILTFLKNHFSEYKFQIIFTTNSPMTLSEMIHKNITRLKKEQNDFNNKKVDSNFISRKVEIDKPTLGANLYDMYKDSFFFDDTYSGKYVDTVINHIVNKLDSMEDLTDTEILELEELINLIGDNVILTVLKEKFKYKKDKLKNFKNENSLEETVKKVFGKFHSEIDRNISKKLENAILEELKNSNK